MTGATEAPAPRAPLTAVLGAAFVLAGLGFGLTAALVCGIALLTLAIGAVTWVELATRGGRLERLPGPGRLEESEPYPLRIRLRRTLLPPPGGGLSDPLLDRDVAVGPRWSRRLDRAVWLQTPGRVQLDPARLIVRDPLGLWERRLHSEAALDLVVLPRIDAVRWEGRGSAPQGQLPGARHAGAAASRRGGLAQFEVDGLRPYWDGSPASRIHWPAVARTGEMIERRLVSGGDPRPLIVFDPRAAAERDHLERAMRATASICVELGRSGGCELLLPGERRPLVIDPALRSWPEAHVRIAVCDSMAGPLLPPGMGGGAVLWVTAGRNLPPTLRRQRSGSFLITPIRSRPAAAFRVSGCFGYSLNAVTERRERRRRAAA
jgi:uncharacterized protein (DUF58 family)